MEDNQLHYYEKLNLYSDPIDQDSQITYCIEQPEVNILVLIVGSDINV